MKILNKNALPNPYETNPKDEKKSGSETNTCIGKDKRNNKSNIRFLNIRAAYPAMAFPHFFLN